VISIVRETTSYKELIVVLNDLCTIVYEKRCLYGMSLRKLAHESGVPFNCISRFERGLGLSLENTIKLLEWVSNK
jgi:ribosome-binding protein aMBF1 (putative translation factor)